MGNAPSSRSIVQNIRSTIQMEWIKSNQFNECLKTLPMDIREVFFDALKVEMEKVTW